MASSRRKEVDDDDVGNDDDDHDVDDDNNEGSSRWIFSDFYTLDKIRQPFSQFRGIATSETRL